jgi:hypothetical protein
MAAATDRLPKWVTNGPAGLEIRLPFYLQDRTSPTKPAMSVSCQERKWHLMSIDVKKGRLGE